MISLQMAILAVAVSGTGETALLDFYSDHCNPCRQMSPVVEQLSREGYPIRKVNVEQDPALASRFRVTGIPCFVLVVDGREVARRMGVVDQGQLKADFQAAGYSPPAMPSEPRHEASDDAIIAPVSMASVQAQDPLLASPESTQTEDDLAAASPNREEFVQQRVRSNVSEVRSANGPERVARPSVETSASADPTSLESQLIAVTARIKVADATGHSYGTGTLIDARGDEVLILTCGHLFRDSKGKGPITVDLFAPGAPQGVPGKLIHYDLKSDVGLVAIRPGVTLKTSHVAANGHVFEKGTEVINVGCNHGEPATARRSKITSINKYLGPPNVQVAGLPVEGRSGGGLFTLDGQVIGVCNAADPEDNEGLYAALDTIHAELDRANLTAVYKARSDDAPVVAASTNAVPTMPQEMPAFAQQAQPTNARATLAGHTRAVPATSADGRDPAVALQTKQAGNPEAGIISDDLLERGEEAEVVCVVRSLNDPTAKSVVVTIKRASPEFLEQLAALRNENDSSDESSAASPRRATVRQVNVARDAGVYSADRIATTELPFQFPWRRDDPREGR